MDNLTHDCKYSLEYKNMSLLSFIVLHRRNGSEPLPDDRLKVISCVTLQHHLSHLLRPFFFKFFLKIYNYIFQKLLDHVYNFIGFF